MRKQIDSLTSIRALAAFWVVSLHSIFQIINSEKISLIPKIIRSFAEKGWMGVDLFFILSGFIMAYVHGHEFNKNFKFKDYKNFLALRLARIYPVHFFCLIGLLFIFLSAKYLLHVEIPVENFELSKFFYSLFLINGIGIPNSIGWNFPTWSLSAELFAYIVFPFGALFIGEKFKTSFRSAVAIFLIICFQIAVAFFINRNGNYYPSLNLTLLRILPEFYIGYFLFSLQRDFKLNDHVTDSILLVSFVAFLTLTQLSIGNIYDVFYEVIFIFVIYSLALNNGFFKKIFSNKFLVYLGKISFSLYIVHAISIIAFKFIAKKIVHYDLFILSIYFIVTYIASGLLFSYIEEPARKFITNYFGIKRTIPNEQKSPSI